ncbi:MAG: NAD+ kinase [Leptonema sp. (in: bacteria)]
MHKKLFKFDTNTQNAKREEKRIILITRKTRLEELIAKLNTKSQVEFFLKTRNQDISDIELEHNQYYSSLNEIKRKIPRGYKLQVLDREFLPNYIFTKHDLIIVLGQDGLVVNTAKYLDGQPILAINPDPERFDGILLPFLPSDFSKVIPLALSDQLPYKELTMAKVVTNDQQVLYAFNDFFIGPQSHISAKYTIHYKQKSERQISSGIIVSTPAGTTGWLSSFFYATKGILKDFFKNNSIRMKPLRLDWEEKRLLFVVREPFRSKWSGVSIVGGSIDLDTSLIIESHMSEKGVIFSDGIEKDYIEFHSGCIAKVSIAEKTTKLFLNSSSSI